jgi:type I restriction enzyme R subunit
LDATVKTLFYDIDGKPISANAFLKKLFRDIPNFFKDEKELREIWSKPNTRKQLLYELSENGYTHAQLKELKKLIKAQNSDIFDVLSYIAYHSKIVPREKRVKQAEIQLKEYDSLKQEFLNFVLNLYVEKGVQELDDTRLKSLLELKYNSIYDAKEALGDVKSIREMFIGFQRYLYEDKVS